MGHVYLAEQHEPIQRKVALKVLHLGVAQPWARRRFTSERQAMGRLDHPNVGKILDAGTTPDGTLYLAMERIEGTRITTYCDEHHLPIEERLRLFAEVCRGVEHAHHKFLLHRDIKPSNVLITEVDGRPVPKLIDFGIAEILDASFADAKAPSAAAGDRHAALHEPGGARPGRRRRHPLRRLLARRAALRAAHRPPAVGRRRLVAGRRRLAAQEHRRRRGRAPAPPASTTAARRRGEPSAPQLVRRLRGDLDAIVLKALAADPEQRYESAAALGEDVERYLEHRPVAARQASTLYRFRRSLRRHRTATVAAALVLIALAAGTVGTTFGLLRARRAEVQARDAAAAAEQARAESDKVVDFLIGLFAASGPDDRETTRSPSETTAAELLERGARRIETDLADQPRVGARLEETIGNVYLQLGLFDAAQQHFERSITVNETLDQPESRLLARSHLGLGEVAIHRVDLEEGRHQLGVALGLLDDRRSLADLRLRADMFNNLGRLERRAADYDAAERAFRRAIELYGRVGDPDDVDRAGAITNLGVLYFVQNRWADAEAQFRRALPIYRRTLPPGHLRLTTIEGNLAAAVASQGRLAEAAPIFERTLAAQRAIVGDEHPRIGDALNNLGVLYQDLGEAEKSVGFHRQALALRQKIFGPDHPITAWSLDNLARSLDDLGRVEEALPLQRRALAIREAHYGPDHIEVGRSVDHLATLLVERGDYRAALPLAERALRIQSATLPAGDPHVGEDSVRIGVCLWHLGRRDEARKSFAEGLAALEADGEDAADELAAARETIAALGAG